ncbi:MAG: nodulation protein NfeD [Nitrospirae bacterium]|nr:nodulation protein NfeD [Nitrospirota bacterium]
MKTLWYKFIILLFLILAIPAVVFAKNDILVVSVNDMISPVSAEFIQSNIQRANIERFTAIIIKLDTPGGLDSSMRSIIKDINQSLIPVIVYVNPSGAHAASAGVFITMAAHVAAMTPGTNIGAAHPVNSNGQNLDSTMKEKVTNDMAAFIKSIAIKRGRNEVWGQEAVRNSVSITEKDALTQHVIDIIANNIDDLLTQLNGRVITINDKPITLNTKDAKIVNVEMGLRYKILGIITNPSVAYILMLLGFYGLYFEFTSPGAIFPGVMGSISIILAFYAFQTLPVNIAGVFLIIIGIILFILEVTIISHGILTIGGIISMMIGSLMLFPDSEPFYKISLGIIIPAVFITALYFILTFRLVYKAWKRKPITGIEAYIGKTASAKTDIFKNGTIMMQGELWSAWSDEFIEKGSQVIILERNGLKVKVRAKLNNNL